jgi:hypothetical protein
MPISGIKNKAATTDIRLIGGSFLQMRINNKDGVFGTNPETPLVAGSLSTVVLGYEAYLGFLPPYSTVESLCNILKDEDKDISRKPPQEILRLYIQKALKPHCLLTHVPLPSSLSGLDNRQKLMWPVGVVTQTFVRSLGLADLGQDSLLGQQGWAQLLEAAGYEPVNVITDISFNLVEKTNRRYYINSFSFWEPGNDDKEAKQHIEACKKWLIQYTKDNPESQSFPIGSDKLMLPIPIHEIQDPGVAYRKAAQRAVEIQARALFSGSELSGLDIPALVDSACTNHLLTASEFIEPDEVIKTIDVKAIA